MNNTATSYEALLARISIWAKAEPNVRALTIFGSQARREDPADEWSDVDLLLVATKPDAYLADAQWLNRFGKVWLSHAERAPVGGVDEQRAVFDGALEVDFTVLSAQTLRLARFGLQILSRMPAMAHAFPRSTRGGLIAIADILGRGAKILVDKDRLMSRLPSMKFDDRYSEKPSERQFGAVTDRFWHGSIWVAKHLRRGELWRAKDGCDVRMKMSILQLIEWHTKATKGWNFDTWAQGRFLERWADPRIEAALGGAFAHYDIEDVWRALFATMEMYRWLGRETAAKLGVIYPTLADECATAWVKRCFCERALPRSVRSV